VSDLRMRWAAAGVGNPERILVTSGSGYLLHVDVTRLDTQRFDRFVRAAEAAAAGGDLRAAAAGLRTALGLWRGPALAGLTSRVLATAAHRWNERRLAVWERCIALELSLGWHGDLVGELSTLAREHPYHEGFTEHEMLALYRCGRQAEALAAYQRIAAALADELGIDPGERLRTLYTAMLRGEVNVTYYDANVPVLDAPETEDGQFAEPQPLGVLRFRELKVGQAGGVRSWTSG
jgi:DNA-binding SARP family transcriptional activator